MQDDPGFRLRIPLSLFHASEHHDVTYGGQNNGWGVYLMNVIDKEMTLAILMEKDILRYCCINRRMDTFGNQTRENH